METVTETIFLGSKVTADGDGSHEIKWHFLAPWKRIYDNLDSVLKRRDITLPKHIHRVKVVVFLVVMYGCEGWTIKKAECLRIGAFELWCWRRLEIPLDSREIKSVHPKGIQSWIYITRTDAEAEAPIPGPIDGKIRLIRKDPDAGKDLRQNEKGKTEDEMVVWHHWLNRH